MSTESLVIGTLIDAENPWPGLSAFDEAAQSFFSGRDAESAELLRLVGQAPLTVLFGKSGLGKTSLVQAGLFPRLRQQNILPVYVRLNVRDRSAPLIQQAAAALQAEVGKHGVDSAAPNADESLWEHLHGRHVEWWSAKNQPLTPVFVFDQFEEAFTLGAENADAIERLRLDLADLIENRIPADLAQRIEAGASAEQLDLRGQRYKVLLSFREDFLPEVEGWKAELPSLMRNRLRLLPMSADRALQVVGGNTPEGRTHELVSDDTAREIVRFVAAVQTGDEKNGRGKSVRKAADPPWEKLELEPALLSLVCEGLNAKRKARGQATIDAALLNETGNAIIGDFYQRGVADVPDKTRRFIEDALITEGGFRNSYPLQDALDQGQLTEPLLRQLVDRRLLRIDHQLGADRVELIHDRLTAVVREHRDKERERIRAQRQRRMRWAVGSVVVVLSTIVAVFFLLWQNARKAEEQTRTALVDAEVAKKNALDEKDRADKAAEAAKVDQASARLAEWHAHISLDDAKKAQQKEVLAADRANRAADSAKAALREAIAGKLVLQSRTLLDGQKTIPMDIALLLAAAGYQLIPSSDALGVLQYALNATPGLLKVVSFAESVIDISNDGRVVVTANKQKKDLAGMLSMLSSKMVLHLGDPATGRHRGETLSVEGTWPNIAFSPDNKTIATANIGADSRETVRFWNSATADPRGKPITQERSPGFRTNVFSAPLHISFSPDGTRVVSSSLDLTLRLWDVASGQSLRVPIQLQKDAASKLEGKTSLSRDETIRLLQDALKELVTCVAFSPDGETILAGYGNGNVRLWNVASGQELGEPLKLHARQVTDVAFSPNGKTVASLDIDGTLYLWDIANVQMAGTWRRGPGNVKSFAFSPDGNTLVTGSSDGTLGLWDVTMGYARSQPIKGHVGVVERVTFISTKILASAGDRTVRLWDIAAWQVDGKSLTEHLGPVTSVGFSPDGKTIVSGSNDGTLRLWSTTTSQSVGDLLPEDSLPLNKSGKGVVAAFASDGKTLSSLDFDGTLSVWDLPGRKAIGPVGRVSSSADKGNVRAIAFSPDGKRIVFASDFRLHLLEVATRRLLCEPWKAHVTNVRDVAFSADGRTIVSSSFGRDLRVWDASTCKQLGRVVFAEESPHTVAVSSDSRTVVSGNQDGTLRLWDIISGHALGSPLEVHTGVVTNIAFSPDGKVLASTSEDKTVRLWDVATRQPIGGALQGHTGKVTVVAFSPDGKTLVSGSSDKALRLWDAPNAWIDRVCAKVVRNLSPAEWKQYVGDIPYVKQCPGLPVPMD